MKPHTSKFLATFIMSMIFLTTIAGALAATFVVAPPPPTLTYNTPKVDFPRFTAYWECMNESITTKITDLQNAKPVKITPTMLYNIEHYWFKQYEQKTNTSFVLHTAPSITWCK